MVMDVNTSPTPEEDAHSPSWPNGLIIITIIINGVSATGSMYLGGVSKEKLQQWPTLLGRPLVESNREELVDVQRPAARGRMNNHHL
jgi:hypothetical protein